MKNKGIIYRGLLYFLVPVLTVSAERATSYVDAPPANVWEIVAWTCTALTGGLVALRAYIDQHISNTSKTA